MAADWSDEMERTLREMEDDANDERIGELPEVAAETAVCQTCWAPVRRDASYASGWRHVAPGVLHGANVSEFAWNVRRRMP